MRVIVLVLVLSSFGWAQESESGRLPYDDIEIETEFLPYLVSNRLLMETTGAKAIRLSNGDTVLLSVASTALKDKSSKERLRAEKVCRVKALASLLAEKKGVQICHLETIEESTRVVIENDKECVTSISEFLQLTQSKVAGIVKDMPVIGRWRSNEGDILYLAIGSRVDCKGEVILPDEIK